MLRVVLCLPPVRLSNEIDTFRAMPDVHLTIVSATHGWGVDDERALRAWRVPVLGAPERWTMALTWMPHLTSAVRPGEADIVVSLELCSPTTAQAQRLARRLGVPHAVVVAENLPRNLVHRVPPWRGLARRAARRADLFVCVTEMASRTAQALGAPPSRCAVVNPGVDCEVFSPRGGGRAQEPTVTFVGQLRADIGADKGATEIIAACVQLHDEISDLRLVLLGDGPLRDRLTAETASMPFIEVRGKVPRTEVPDALRDSRVFVLAPSATVKWSEQFGFAVVEALASGLPVVTTRSGALPEVVPAWNPSAAEGDVAGLVEGIRMALGPAGDAWGASNRELALLRYDVRRQAVALRDVLAAASAVKERSAARRHPTDGARRGGPGHRAGEQHEG